MNLPDNYKVLTPWLERHRRMSWTPIVKEGDVHAAVSKFGGSAVLGHDEQWPKCNECGSKLSLYVQIDLAKTPSSLNAQLTRGLLQAFFCDACFMSGEYQYEGDPFAPDHLIRILDLPPDASRIELPAKAASKATRVVPRIITGWKPEEDYPSATDAEEFFGINIEQKHIDKADRYVLTCTDPPVTIITKLYEPYRVIPWAREGDKLGGWAAWVNVTPDYPPCPKCQRPMDVMLFQIGYEDHLPQIPGDGALGYIVCCPDHPHELAFPTSSN